MRGWEWNGALVGAKCSFARHPQAEAPFTKPLGLCSCCKPAKPLVLRYDPDQVSNRWGRKLGQGLFRFAALLPGMIKEPCFAGDVGDTPILEHPLGKDLDVTLYLKNEGQNPSGSFKDRGLAMGIALAWATGGKRFCLPTQGNAGVAAAMFCSRLGLPPCSIYMPESYRGNIYHRAAEHFGAEVQFHGANIGASGKKMREDLAQELARGEVVELSTFFEPGRLEGKKTMGLEIAEYFGSDLPEWIFYPTGGGTGLVGIWKAFQELVECGILPKDVKLPKMVAVQSSNCCPVVDSFNKGEQTVTPITSKGTMADGLDVPGAIMGHAILEVLRSSGGLAVAVDEQDIKEAYQELATRGITAGYEAAATWSALKQLRAADIVKAQNRVLLLLTGSHQVPLAKGINPND